jgi:hypothetical protein
MDDGLEDLSRHYETGLSRPNSRGMMMMMMMIMIIIIIIIIRIIQNHSENT